MGRLKLMSFQGGRDMLKMHSWRTTSLAMALTAIVGLALPALGGEWRTFRGHAEERLGPVDIDTDNSPCLMGCVVTAAGAGWATYLGRFRRMSCVAVNPVDGSAEGITAFIAANGDTLCAEAKVEPPNPEDNTVRRGTYTFTETGGTGRFRDASGGAYFEGVVRSDSSGNIHIAVNFGGIIRR